MMLPGMPALLSPPGGFVITTGSITFTVGKQTGIDFFGYSDGVLDNGVTYGSVSSDTLVSVDGVVYPVSLIRTNSNGPNANQLYIFFDSEEMALAVIAFLNAEFTEASSAIFDAILPFATLVPGRIEIFTTATKYLTVANVGQSTTVSFV